MKTLVKKDIELMGWNNLLIIMLGVIFGTFSLNSYETDSPQILMLWIGIMIIYLSSYILTAEDGKTKDVILRSLPIDKRDIVLSRYITMLIYVISIFAIMYITSQIYSFADGLFAIGKPISIWSILFNIIISMNLISIVLPIQYISIKIGKILNVILYFLIIIVPIIINRTNYNNRISQLFSHTVDKILKVNPFIFMIIGILLYFISFLISTKLYKSIDR